MQWLLGKPGHAVRVSSVQLERYERAFIFYTSLCSAASLGWKHGAARICC